MKTFKFFALLAMLLATACGTLEVNVESKPTTTTPAITPTTAGPLPTAALQQPSPTTPLPSPTDMPPADVSTTDASVIETQAPVNDASSTPQMVQIFMIAVDDNGQSGKLIGCGDSAVPVQVEIQPTQGILRAALEQLLSLKSQYYGESGLYNSLYQSDLQVESVKIEAGKAMIQLTGSVVLGGECDTPRFKAQIEGTAMQFSTVTSVEITINGKPLDDVLSLRGSSFSISAN